MMQFKTVEEFRAQTGKDAPTEAEEELIAACRAGEPCILSETRPTSGTNANTIRAPLLRLLITGGTPDCGLHESGVWVKGAWITGTLDLAYCTARGQTVLDACHFVEEPAFPSAKLNLLSLEGSHIPGLFAQGMEVSSSVFLRNLTATGTVALNSAKIGGQLSCIGADLNGAEQDALNAQGVEIGQDVFLRNLTATGTVDVNSAKIGGQLDCTGATLNGEGQMALNAQGVETGQDLFLRNLTATGTVDVNGAKIGGQLDCTGATLNGAGGRALDGQRIVVSAGLVFREVKSIIGQVNLTAAHVGDLVDDMTSWPKGADDLILDGFTYDRITGWGPVTLSARRDWLRIGSSLNGDFFPQPYTHFARTLRAMGHAPEAKLVLAEQARLLGVQERKLQRQRPDGSERLFFENPLLDLRLLFMYLTDLALRWFAGYGHRPLRSFFWLIGLFLAATALAQAAWEEGSFAPNSDVILTSPDWTQIAAQGCVVADAAECLPNPAAAWSAKNAPGMDWDSFFAPAYAADLVVPLIDLGQTRAWAPSKDRGPLGLLMWWGRWFFIIAGWVVASLGLAAVTGFVQKNAPD